jgi:hypothetical protein
MFTVHMVFLYMILEVLFLFQICDEIVDLEDLSFSFSFFFFSFFFITKLSAMFLLIGL